MVRGAYYNDCDPYASSWLRKLIADGLLPVGDVDDRPIEQVAADDLRGYRHCHFFAGVGGWALASVMAEWPADRELWTGSCPCQPFSTAGKLRGTRDPRHLWPHFFRLIGAARPAVVMGEQVARAPGRAWLDGVLTDLEGAGYATRAIDLPACAVNAPILRHRLYWLATDMAGADCRRRASDCGESGDPIEAWAGVGRVSDRHAADDRAEPAWRGAGAWDDAVRLVCPDGAQRRSPPGIRLLVDGSAGLMVMPGAGAGGESVAIRRLAAWRGIGQAIVPQLAAEVMAAYLETEP